jgi:hypothetical protein
MSSLFTPQSETYMDYSINRIPTCLSLRRDFWFPPCTSSPLSSVSPPLTQTGGADSLARGVEGGWTKFGRLDLCIICGQ